MLKKKVLIEKIFGKYPRFLFLRRLYNGQRIAYYANLCISPVKLAEQDLTLNRKTQLISEYEMAHSHEKDKVEKELHKVLDRAPEYKGRETDSGLIQEMKFNYYAYGFTPDEFLCYHLEGRPEAETSSFVSDREVMQYVYQMNDRASISLFNDKAKTYQYFSKYYKRECIEIETEKDFFAFREYVKRHPVFVKKNVREAMGRSVALVDTTTTGTSISELFDAMVAEGKHILEEKIVQSEAFSKLNASSVNTVRFITFFTKHGVEVPYSFMKIGRAGSFVDNGGAGGILVGIDLAAGCLNTDGFDENNNRYVCHPDSEIPFKGYPLPDFLEAVQLARELSAKTPEIKFVGWDFTHTNNGWVVVEGNGMSQLIGPQVVMQRGVKAEVKSLMERMELLG